MNSHRHTQAGRHTEHTTNLYTDSPSHPHSLSLSLCLYLCLWLSLSLSLSLTHTHTHTHTQPHTQLTNQTIRISKPHTISLMYISQVNHHSTSLYPQRSRAGLSLIYICWVDSHNGSSWGHSRACTDHTCSNSQGLKWLQSFWVRMALQSNI